MELSRYNIIVPIHNSDAYAIINLLHKQADVLSQQEKDLLINHPSHVPEEFITKGYIIDPEQEKEIYNKAYLDFLDQRENDEIQLFYVPTYQCNFNCSYCYQEDYTKQSQLDPQQTIPAFFDYIAKAFAGKKKYITIFGGEPLLLSQSAKESIALLCEYASKAHIEIAVVTNGYHLEEYLSTLQQATIREIQVTLDGMAPMHNKRRPLKNGHSTFDAIVVGINKALQQGININLRMVVDKENVSELPKLAQFAIDQGWTDKETFKTQLGRNYELHTCQANQSKLYSRIDLYRDVYNLILQHPAILAFHKPAFSISRFLFENGELPEPLFDSCPGCKTEWAFDSSGAIYSCTATVGKQGEKLGTYYPAITHDEETIEAWQERDVLSIEKCRTCHVQLACGGGCASVAKNKNGNLHSYDCRPIEELLSYGLSLYFPQEDEDRSKNHECHD